MRFLYHTVRLSRFAAALLCVSLVALASCGNGGGGGDDVDVGGQQPTPTNEVTYAGMGASDARGAGAIPGTKGYVYLIRDRLRDRGLDTTLVNTGINGAEIDELLDPQLPQVLDAAPHIVTIWTGANDMIGGADPDEFADGLDELLSSLRANTSARIYVGDLVDFTVAPIFNLFPRPTVTLERLAAFNARIQQVVADNGCTLVPLSEGTLTRDMFFIDGFHPNNLGYEMLADAFWEKIEADLE